MLNGIPLSAALTAYAGQGNRRLAFEAGFDAHVAKPAEPETLVATLAGLAGRAETEEADGSVSEA